MIDRRHFLKNSAVISLVPAIPTFLPKTTLDAGQVDNGRILVVIQLDGGNDGINTVVPFKDEGYARYRKELRLADKDLIKLDQNVALHPRLRSISELFQEGRLSILHGVGYPNPNRSHFESMAIWHSASLDQEKRAQGAGWLGEAISLQQQSTAPQAIHVGSEDLPVALRGRRCVAATIASPADLQLTLSDVALPQTLNSEPKSLIDFVTRSVSDAYASAKELANTTHADTSAKYPNSKLARHLKLVGQLIKADMAARVYYTSQGGYDTHAVQLPTHANLLGQFSSSLRAFMNDMKSAGLEDRILVMAFSEFGRRVKENASLGTDHGTAGPVFLSGTGLTSRAYGDLPSLLDLENGDLKHSTDFREVYAAILTGWLQIQRPSTLSEFGTMRLWG